MIPFRPMLHTLFAVPAVLWQLPGRVPHKRLVVGIAVTTTLAVLTFSPLTSVGLIGESVAANPPPAAKPALSVTVATPKTQQWANSITANGALQAWQEAIVASELGGVAISALHVDVGSKVKRGQVLAQLAPETIRASLAAQQANVARAKAALAEARANAERARNLKDSGALSEQQIQQLLLGEDAAKAALSAALAMQRIDEVRMAQTSIRAIDDGIISARNATLGAVVQPGGELFRLVRQGRIEWRAELTAEQLGQLKPGLKARINLSDGSSADGTLRMLAPTLDSLSRKGIAYVDLAADSHARAGMFGQGEIFLGDSQALTIPHSALLMRDGNSYVFEVNAKNQVEQRKVKTGRRVGDAVEILTGLEASAKVITRGAAFLNSGDTVQVVSDINTATQNKAAAK
ncbi:MAG: efflux RND transporter periplasmic adaptor subunit [Sterolibacterium sp.]|nr:efflux RND transporter periplasmic adaptor subunit [Sterolibacterium sp.]